MAGEHDRLLKQSRVDDNFKFPSGRPLVHLFEAVKGRGEPSRQRILDRSLEMLEELVRSDAAIMKWEELQTIRRYTINFNPAIEFEQIVEPESTKRGS